MRVHHALVHGCQQLAVGHQLKGWHQPSSGGFHLYPHFLNLFTKCRSHLRFSSFIRHLAHLSCSSPLIFIFCSISSGWITAGPSSFIRFILHILSFILFVSSCQPDPIQRVLALSYHLPTHCCPEGIDKALAYAQGSSICPALATNTNYEKV